MDIAAIQAENELLRETLKRQAAHIERLERQLRQTQERLEALLRAHYGRKSEKIQPGQSELDLGMTDAADVIPSTPAPAAPVLELLPPARKPRAKRGRRVIPDDLPEVVQIHDLSPEQKACAGCGREMTLIGTDDAVKIAYEPATLTKLVHRQCKYACKCGCEQSGIGVHTAPRPSEPIPGCLADASLLAHVAVSKTQDHLPVHRITTQLARLGFPGSRATVNNWYLDTAEVFEPVYQCLKASVLACPVLHHDDTPIREMEKGKGQCRTSRIWVAARGLAPWHVVFDYTRTRGQEGPKRFLADYRGHLVADACPVYDGLYESGGIVEVGCWAHTRRGFHDAHVSGEGEALPLLAQIRALYRIEAEARDKSLDAMGVFALRQERSKPIVDKIGAIMKGWRETGRLLPKSLLGKAVTYAENQWEALNRFLWDGRLPIDNNRAENLIRPLAVGRKNWLFFGNDRGGRAAAVLHSLMVTCRMNQVNPYAYIEDVLRRIMDHSQTRIAELLPDQWQAKRAAATAAAI